MRRFRLFREIFAGLGALTVATGKYGWVTGVPLDAYRNGTYIMIYDLLDDDVFGGLLRDGYAGMYL